jgi:hypothetical protein
VLLHCHSPLRIVEQCARRADTLIITEIHDPGLEGLRACQFLPTAEEMNWHTWWRFSPDLFIEFLRVMGFSRFSQTFHTQQTATGSHRLFTIVARRDPAPGAAAGPAAEAPALDALQASIRQLREELDLIGAKAG